ncbi:MAG TPA: phosphate signaling complex protein PhoU [Planctomycetes bacterium]|nr:phosphate signaling complex protein PhoU [Planctomycetota bacterium]
MTIHLQRDLTSLKENLLRLGREVEKAIDKACTVLVSRKGELVEEVVYGDRQIDMEEVAIEEECLKILALHQPVATDLRFVVAILKVNNDLERMGDLAVNIANRGAFLAKEPQIGIDLPFPDLISNVKTMVRDSLLSLVSLDPGLATKVRERDDRVDQIHKQMFEILQKFMQENPKAISRAINHLSASRALERIADLATNIAEDVLFMTEGRIVRHQ